MKRRTSSLCAIFMSAAMALSPMVTSCNVMAAEESSDILFEVGQEEDAELMQAAEEASLEDGVYTVSLDSSLTMFHFDNPVKAVVNGDTATVTIRSITANASNGARYDQLYIGSYAEISADTSKGVAGVAIPGAGEVEGTDAYEFTVEIPTSQLVTGTQIPYVLRYRVGYSEKHNGDWYQSSTGNDYYFTVGEIQSATSEQALAVTNTTAMFKANSASLVTNKLDGTKELLLTLSGTSYKYMFKGTYEEALADGCQDTTQLIAGVLDEVESGKYTFHIPVADGETNIPLISLSDTKYQSYLEGSGELSAAAFARQAVIDETAATVTVGDFDGMTDLTVTNNVSMFKVSSAALETIGSSNANNYKEILQLTMGSTSYDKAYVGSAEDAATAETTIDLDENNVFAIPVKANVKGGSVDYDYLDKAITVAFHAVKSGSWFERVLTVSKDGKTLLVNPLTNEQTLTVTNTTAMFKANSASLVTNNLTGAKELLLTLSGTSYKYMFKGTYEEALADGCQDTTQLIAGVLDEVESGKYTFHIPVADGETNIPLISLSDTKYQSYLEGSGELSAAAFARQAVIDETAATVTVGDFDGMTDLTVTNNVSVFKTASAALETIGSSNANNYKEILQLTMENADFDKVYVGSASDAASAETTIALNENNVFAIPVKANVKGGSVDYDYLDKETTVAIHEASSGLWYEALLTVSKNEKTAVLDPVKVTAVTLNESEVNLKVGETKDLTAAVLPETTTSKVTWTSSNEDVASVEDGKVTAKAAGKAVITAEAGDVKAEAAVNVTLTDGLYYVSFESTLGMFHLEENPAIAVVKGDTATITLRSITANTSNGSRYDQMYIGTYDEIMADTSKAIVGKVITGAGEVEGTDAYEFTFDIPVDKLGLGENIEYVLRYREGYSETHSGDWYQGTKGGYYLNVGNIASLIPTVTISAKQLSLKVGETKNLTAAVEPEGVSSQLTWKSSNTSVATVANGKVTAKAAGKAVITAEAGGVKATATVTVTKPVVKVTKIKLSSALSVKIAAGKKVQLKAAVTPANAANKKVTWTSGNTKVATVNSKGLVTMKKNAGGKTVTIKAVAADGSKVYGSIKLTCTKGYVKSLKIKGSKSVKAGKSLKLTAKVTTKGSGANKSLKWTSSNTKLAKVSSAGKVTTFKGKKGTVKITVQSLDGTNLKKTVSIKVK